MNSVFLGEQLMGHHVLEVGQGGQERRSKAKNCRAQFSANFTLLPCPIMTGGEEKAAPLPVFSPNHSKEHHITPFEQSPKSKIHIS